ncbi:8973_t:CDS:2 [Ambispora leptoticha]|uniref:8973_t:CDS:1 n=1 Tax=Ambispora leptoticha TaxID=144679 RepID=A0A9N9BY83_9GLOM|nr:8973_t:CDS:2 [Ambispora leptoticha]
MSVASTTINSGFNDEEEKDRVGQNFRWPVSMNDCDRETAFFYIADDAALEFDDETGFNLVAFFDNLDKSTFDEHKDNWVLVYKQEVKKYGSKLTGKELFDLEGEMPGAIYLQVDKSRREDLVKVAPIKTVCVLRAGNEHMILRTTNSVTLTYNFRDPNNRNKLYKTIIDSAAPETILPYHVRRMLGKRGWHPIRHFATGYGAPSRVYVASMAIEVAIGDDNSWSKWIRTDTLRV